jgi:hypothetical protein
LCANQIQEYTHESIERNIVAVTYHKYNRLNQTTFLLREQQAKEDVEKFLIDTCGAHVNQYGGGDTWRSYYLEHLVISVSCTRNVIKFQNRKVHKSLFCNKVFCAPTQFKEILMKALDGTLWQ